MLSVLPIQSKEEQAQLCRLSGCEYDVDLLAYKITDGDKFCGICQFRIGPNGGEIKDLCCPETNGQFEYQFMLARGTMNFIDLCHMRYAYLDDRKIDEITAKAIGFAPDENGRQKIDLLHFFEEPCKHDK